MECKSCEVRQKIIELQKEMIDSYERSRKDYKRSNNMMMITVIILAVINFIK